MDRHGNNYLVWKLYLLLRTMSKAFFGILRISIFQKRLAKNPVLNYFLALQQSESSFAAQASSEV